MNRNRANSNGKSEPATQKAHENDEQEAAKARQKAARKRRTRGGKSEAEGGTPVWLSAQHQPGTDKAAETRDRTGDLQIFSLTLSQLSYRGLLFGTGDDVERALGWCEGSVCLRISYEGL